MDKYVARIGEETDPAIVGGKGASLSRLKRLGFNVPDGLTITTAGWRAWRRGKLDVERLYHEHVSDLLHEIAPALGVEQSVSVRSGAAKSMPGMMDTILNVGGTSNAHKLAYLMSRAKATGLDPSVVQNMVDEELINSETFFVEEIRNQARLIKKLSGYVSDVLSMTVDEQIMDAVQLVFSSWDSDRAKYYRKTKGIRESLGTACTIQLMVDGLQGFTGVMLSRGDGHRQIDWLMGSQGEAVVDGSHSVLSAKDMKSNYPAWYKELMNAADVLEREYHDAVDVEFTFDGEKLYFLQCRPMKRGPVEAMRIAVELHEAGIYDADQIMATPVVDDSSRSISVSNNSVIASGSPINGKLLSGKLIIDIENTEIESDSIVLRGMTTTNDIALISRCAAVLTIKGGPTCHAALVSRELNITSVVGVGGAISKGFTEKTGTFSCWNTSDGDTIKQGDTITILPNGKIYAGEVKTRVSVIKGEWSKRLSALKKSLKQDQGTMEKSPALDYTVSAQGA